MSGIETISLVVVIQMFISNKDDISKLQVFIKIDMYDYVTVIISHIDPCSIFPGHSKVEILLNLALNNNQSIKIFFLSKSRFFCSLLCLQVHVSKDFCAYGQYKGLTG